MLVLCACAFAYVNPVSPFSRSYVKAVNALFIVGVHLAMKLVYGHPTFNNVKETIQS